MARKCHKAWKKANIRNRYNQVPHLTQATIWVSDKHTRKRHTRESKEVSPFSAGGHKDARNRQNSIIKTCVKHKQRRRVHKRSTALERSVKQLLEGLNVFNGANLTLNSDFGSRHIDVWFNHGSLDRCPNDRCSLSLYTPSISKCSCYFVIRDIHVCTCADPESFVRGFQF